MPDINGDGIADMHYQKYDGTHHFLLGNGDLTYLDLGQLIDSWCPQNEQRYWGCFASSDFEEDGQGNHQEELTVYLGSVKSVAQCIEYGSQSGQKYVGIENGDSCWGGDSFGRYSRSDGQWANGAY